VAGKVSHAAVHVRAQNRRREQQQRYQQKRDWDAPVHFFIQGRGDAGRMISIARFLLGW
jgi:hypothetical protein